MLRGKLSFEEKGIEKQEQAYKASYAKKQFQYSCEKCCLENKLRDCANCSIKKAHIDALARIALSKSKKEKLQYGATKKRNGSHVTIVIHFNS